MADPKPLAKPMDPEREPEPTGLDGTAVPLTLATFLMTDIEGSTRLWEAAATSMPTALEAHDAILRAAVDEAGGTVFKTTGDGLLARFDAPAPAIGAAIEGQRRLSDYQWPPDAIVRCRIAVHSGSAQARSGDYFGPALNRVARLLAIGRGGQVLVSGITAALVAEQLPAGATLIDRGEHRLRDVDEPVRVYQLAAPGLDSGSAPLRTTGSGRSNLPIHLTSFVGREREQAEVTRLLASNRLVTLTGTGGTGKTRLMLEVGAQHVDAYPDGVWLTELAPIIDPAMVLGAVAQALAVQVPPGAATPGALEDYVRAKSMLLLLDNCEHVIAAAASLAAQLLETAPGLKILATGREALGVPGEVIVQVPSLADAESLRLFAERAAAVAPSFRLTPANEGTVAEICRRLDGIPLAIELAAARVPVLSVDEILERLGDRFRLLTGGRRTAVPRQQTLQALIDWSWDLLGDTDRRLLRRLSVFAGGSTLEAATMICGEPASDNLAVLDALTHLVERSLVVAEAGTTTRYRLGETIRQYGRDRLVESGEAEATRTRHLGYFLGLAERAEREMVGPGLIDWLRRLDADADNLQVAIEWGLESDHEAAIRLCTALWAYWRARPTAAIAAETWLERALDSASDLPAPLAGRERERQVHVARMYAVTAFIGAMMLSRDTRAIADAGLALARESGDPWTLAFCLSAAGTARIFAGTSEGLRELAEETIRVAAQVGDRATEASAAAGLAGAIWLGGSPAEIERARALLEHAARLASSVGDALMLAFIALLRGRIEGAAGRLPEARAAFHDAAAWYSEVGDPLFALIAESDLAHAARRSGELDEATRILRRTLPEWVRTGSRGAIANQLESFAMISFQRGDPGRAGRLLGAAEALRQAAQAAMLPFERIEYDAVVQELRAEADRDELDVAWAEGGAMTEDAAIAFALT